MLYASSQRLGCYLETLARFRVDLTLYAELSEIEGEDDFTSLGHVPLAWAKPRMLGSAEHDGKYADLYGSDWIGLLRRGLAADCLELGITELDASVLEGSNSRALTQRASRLVFRNAFDGIYCRSKFGHDIQNWALFEESGTVSADAVAAERFVPKSETSAPGGIGCPVLLKLAPFRTPPGAITGFCAPTAWLRAAASCAILCQALKGSSANVLYSAKKCAILGATEVDPHPSFRYR